MDLAVYQSGYVKCQRLYSYKPSSRGHYLFYYIIHGKGTLRVPSENDGTVDYSLSEGSMFLLEPGYEKYYQIEHEEPWEYIWIKFSGIRARNLINAAGFSHDQPVFRPDDPKDRELLRKELLTLVKDNEVNSLGAVGHMYLFMDRLIQTSSSGGQIQEEKNNEHERYVQKAVTYIEENYAKDISVEELARKCWLERSYFGKVFKSVVGQSPQKYLMDYRMKKAAEALIASSQTVGEIGESVGYSNPLHFSRAFKSVYGISPREYRQRKHIEMQLRRVCNGK